MVSVTYLLIGVEIWLWGGLATHRGTGFRRLCHLCALVMFVMGSNHVALFLTSFTLEIHPYAALIAVSASALALFLWVTLHVTRHAIWKAVTVLMRHSPEWTGVNASSPLDDDKR